MIAKLSLRVCAVLLGFAATSSSVRADEPTKNAPVKKAAPRVEVVFCLDTTGSMSQLINAAKQKIWSISNQIAAGTPTPDLRIGLIGYRDRTDTYVTKIYDLTDDLDGMYANLMKFQTGGGGDTAESVNQALHEAVHKMKWTKGKNVLRIIFLVGDAPPHMDYKDDVKYPKTCEIAAKRGIIINTVQCGNIPGTDKIWKEISNFSEGSYVRIAPNANPVVAVKTPFDAKLAKINEELVKTTVVFGSPKEQKRAKMLNSTARKLTAEKAADRAAAFANLGRGATYDLVENIRKGKVKLKDLKQANLPPVLKSKTIKEQKAYLDKMAKRRSELNKTARELDKKRRGYIAEKQKKELKNKVRDSFDLQVNQLIQRQAKRVNIRYENVEEPKKNVSKK